MQVENEYVEPMTAWLLSVTLLSLTVCGRAVVRMPALNRTEIDVLELDYWLGSCDSSRSDSLWWCITPPSGSMSVVASRSTATYVLVLEVCTHLQLDIQACIYLVSWLLHKVEGSMHAIKHGPSHAVQACYVHVLLKLSALPWFANCWFVIALYVRSAFDVPALSFIPHLSLSSVLTCVVICTILQHGVACHSASS